MPQAIPLHDTLVAPEISTAAAESRTGLDIQSGCDRRPVSMALLKARRAGASPSFRAVSGGAQDYHCYRQLSYYIFLYFIHQNTHKQDRQAGRQRHPHAQYLRHGELLGQREEGGHGTAHFFF